MTTASILPNGKTQFIDINGKPLVGGTVTFYEPGTLVLKDTWQDDDQTILNTNPVVLDSRGQAIIYGYGIYRQRVKDAAGNLIWDEETAAPYSPVNPPPDADFIYRDIYMEGKPDDGELYPVINMPIAQYIPIAMAGSVITIDPNFLPTSTFTITLYQTTPPGSPASIGTIAIDTSGNVVVTFPTQINFAARDQLSFVWPSPQDATAENIAIALVTRLT
jgi:hypothetical protein